MKKDKTLVYIIIGVLALILGFYLGFKYGKRNYKIDSHSTTKIEYKIDTLKENIYITKPINKIVYINKPIYQEPTTIIQKEYINVPNNVPIFITQDTLRYKKLFVSLLDSGDCNGIFSRQYQFLGTEETKIITNTITNTVTKKPPLFSIYGGLNSRFASGFKIVDIGPLLQLSIKQKYIIGYSYLISENNNNIHLGIKLK